MNQKPQGRAEEIFREVLNAPPEARRSVLGTACGRDSELRRLVEQLLQKQSQRGPSTAAETATASILGRQLGPYHIVAPLGAGGMGEGP
jgi:hypothetical protein